VTLDAFVDEIATRHKTVTVYAPEPTDLAARLATRNATVDHRRLPADGPEPFAVVRADGRFLGLLSLDTLRSFLEPPIPRSQDPDDLSPPYRAVFELLDDTVFASLSRRQLLATSRGIEDRAWRTGRGTLHVGFQSAAAFRAQQSLYRRLAETTDLDVHVYAVTDGTPPDTAATVHTEPVIPIGRYWFLVFDGGGDDDRKCALVAEQRAPNTYDGGWTFDPALVDRILADGVTGA
jgi:hypothetical protein